MHPVGAGDGLHQGMGLERFVQVQSGQARHIEAGQPHGADNGDPERVRILLEGLIQSHALHVAETGIGAHRGGQFDAFLDQPTVRRDIEIPLAKLVHLALFFTDDHGHPGLAHPVDLSARKDFFLLVRDRGKLLFQRLDAFSPVKLDQPVHAHAGDLVDTHQHGLAGLPGRRIVPHEIPRHLIETLARRDDVVIALEFPLQALLDIDVVRLQFLQLLGNTLVEIIHRDAELVAPGIVVERHGRVILHRALKIVGGNIVAKYAPGDLIVGEQWRAGKTDIARVGQGVAHVQRQRAVLGAVGLVGNDNDIIPPGVALVGIDCLVELLDQRKDVGLVLSQQFAQMLPADGAAGVAIIIDHFATGEGLVELGIEILTVSQDHKGKIAAQLAAYLAGEHHHRIALARALGMPEHAQPALAVLPVAHRLDGPVYPEELVIAGDNLAGLAGRFIEQNKVFQQIHEIALVAHPLEQGLHVHHARLILGQPLPLVEMRPLAGQRPDLRLLAVAEHDNGVVVEQVGNGIAIVGIILLERRLQIPVDVLALDEQQRQAIDEADDIRPPPVQISAHPQLTHAEEMVVLRLLEIEYPQALAHPLTVGIAEPDLHPILDQVVFLPVRRQQGLGSHACRNLTHGIVIGFIGKLGIEFDQLLPQWSRQHNLAVRSPAQHPVRAESLVVVGVNRLPPEFLFQILGCRLLG